MKLTCPHCEYSRKIDPQQIPEGTVRVKCPLCNKSFDLPPAQPAAQDQGAHETEPKGTEPADSQPSEPVSSTEQQERPDSSAADPELVVPPEYSSRQQPSSMDAVPKAGFWIRVVATLVDAFIVFGLQFLLGSILAVAGTVTTVGAETGAGETAMVVHLFNLTISFAYYVFFTGYNGQTPGKMALRIKVIRRDGAPVGYARAAFREVPAKFLSGILFGIGYLMVAFDEQKRGLHDRMSDTYVIKL